MNARRFFKQMLNARGIFGTEGTRADVEAWNRGDAQVRTCPCARACACAAIVVPRTVGRGSSGVVCLRVR